MKHLFLTTVMVGAFVYGNIVYGQGNLANATIQGRVLDETGAAIPGVDVELVDLDKGTKLTSQSDNAGYYHFQVPFGNYSLTAKVKEFGDTVVSPLKVTAKEVANIDLTMKPGAVVQTIDVTASTLRLESETSDVGQDLVKEMVTTQPIAHRNVIELVGLMPGVLQNRTVGGSTMNTREATATWGRSNFTIGGGMRNTSSFVINGVDATHSFGPGGGNAMVFVGPDSVEEFRLHLYDYPADLPRGSGVLSIVTKSGTNALHGAAYYFHQNSALNANDFFTNRNGRPRPPLQRHEFGGHIGGPVVIPKLYNGRNKTFFFFDYDQIRQPLSQTYQMRVPTAAELSGDFSGVYATNGNPIILYNPFDTFVDPATGRTLRRPFPNNRIPPGLINQFAKNLTSYYPQANVPGGTLTAGGLPTNVNNFFTNAAAPFKIHNEHLRIDHNVGDNLRFSFQRIFNPPPVACPNPYGTVASPVNCNTEKPIFLSGTVNWNINSRLLLSMSGDWMDAKKHIDNLSQHLDQPFDMSSLGGPYSKGTPFSNLLLRDFGFEAFPSFSIGGYGGLGSASVAGVEATGGGQANLSWSKGRHNMKYGFQFYNRPVVFSYPTSTAGGFTATNLSTTGAFTNGPDPLLPDVNTGNALADLQLGILGGGVVNLPSLERTYRDTYYAWYVQDDWKVSSKLTLNLGLRYDIGLSFREASNYTAVFNPNLPNPIGNSIGPNTGGQTLNQFFGRELTGGYVFALSHLIGGRERPASSPYKDISPRIGFAYAPTSKWVIRGGFAKIFFHGINGVTDNGNCPSCTGVTPVIASIDGIRPNPAVTLNNPFPTGFNQATGSSLGLLTGLGLPLTETGAAFPVTPYAWQYSGGFQRELPFNSRLSMMYVASRGRNLACPNDLCNDQLPLSLVQQYGNRLNDVVPNPFYGIITNPSSILSQPTVQQWRLLMNWPQFPGGSIHIPAAQNKKGFPLFATENPFKSSWNAMLLSYEKRLSDGLHLQVAYTWSKTISNVDAFDNWMAPTPSYQNIYEVEKEKSLSSEDVPHRLVLSHVYQLPFGKGKRFAAGAPGVVDQIIGGWELGGNLTLASGTPLFVNVTPNNSNTHMANGALRPNLVRTPTATEGDRGQKIQQWFDTSAFAAPAPFTYGDAPRTIGQIRSDGIKSYDMSLMKWFPLHGEAFKMQLRMDAFNLFNRTQFGFPNTTLGSPTFATVTSVAAPPRFIQVGFRFQW